MHDAMWAAPQADQPSSPVAGCSWSPVGVGGTMRGAGLGTPPLRGPHSVLEDYAQQSAVWGTTRKWENSKKFNNTT